MQRSTRLHLHHTTDAESNFSASDGFKTEAHRSSSTKTDLVRFHQLFCMTLYTRLANLSNYEVT